MRKTTPLWIAIVAVAIVLAIRPGARAADLISAARLYQAHCAECHGDDGHGDGPTSAITETKPRDFADCDLMRKLSDHQMLEVIRDGGYPHAMSADMPSWRYALSNQDMVDLVAYVRRFCKRYAAAPEAHEVAISASGAIPARPNRAAR